MEHCVEGGRPETGQYRRLLAIEPQAGQHHRSKRALVESNLVLLAKVCSFVKPASLDVMWMAEIGHLVEWNRYVIML